MNTTNTISPKLDTENNEKQVMNTTHRLKDIINLPSEISEEEIQDFINKEIHWIQSDEYIIRKMAATGKSKESIKKDVEKILTQLQKTTLEFNKNTEIGTGGIYRQDENNPKTRVFESSIVGKKHSAKHEVTHTLSEHALETGDDLLRLFNREYKNYPNIKVIKWYDKVNPSAKASARRWANDKREQQVVARSIMDYIEETQGVKRGEKINISNINILRDDMNKLQKENNRLQKEDLKHSDIRTLMLAFQRKYGDNYPSKLLELLNTAY